MDCFLTTTTENEYLKGMRDGKYTYEQELKQNRTQGRLQQLNQQHSQGNRDQDHEQ
ncbi:hypothetical protein [Dokdonia pacifica]|uniref:hypothetical protein n=1 Tax=Dokdonia pacifica TaxID=1627892 RepID=UPI0015C69698|nr:hypothetical protein [Dokdonia pacifica]